MKELLYGTVSGNQIRFTYQRERSAAFEITATKVRGSEKTGALP